VVASHLMLDHAESAIKEAGVKGVVADEWVLLDDRQTLLRMHNLLDGSADDNCD